MSDDIKALTKALAAPFAAGEVKFKPQVVKNNKALALPYVDARVVQDRLDEVLGVEGWSDLYELLPDGSAVCRLSCKLGGEWVTKMDVGSPSEQPDAGDRVKAAFSDALKRAAVKFGVGRYLYRQAPQWADYDLAKRQFTRQPQLAAGAGPKAAPAKPAGKGLPATGAEMLGRLEKLEAELVGAGRCKAGELLLYMRGAGAKAGHPGKLGEWGPEAIRWSVEATQLFLAAHPARGDADDGPARREPAPAVLPGAGGPGPYARGR